MRDRLQMQLEDQPTSGSGAAPAATVAGEPVERRYPLDEFERLFEGYTVDVRGTIAGIEKYGSRPDAISPLRRDIGELTYRLLVDIEDTLIRHDLDLSAKHWALSARKGSGGIGRRQRRHLAGQAVAPTLAGPYDAAYKLESAPGTVTSGAEFAVVVVVTNRSWREWASHDEARIFLSSRVLGQRGEVVTADGPRTPFPRTVQPGEACFVYLKVRAPNQPGQFRVLVDGVHEGVSWFSDAGTPPLEFSLRVTPSRLNDQSARARRDRRRRRRAGTSGRRLFAIVAEHAAGTHDYERAAVGQDRGDESKAHHRDDHHPGSTCRAGRPSSRRGRTP